MILAAEAQVLDLPPFPVNTVSQIDANVCLRLRRPNVEKLALVILEGVFLEEVRSLICVLSQQNFGSSYKV